MDKHQMAIAVDQAAKDAQAIAQLSNSRTFTVDEAYQIQRQSIERRLSRGEKFIGVKMGFTSEAKMQQMGVHDLIFGVLTDGMWIENESHADFSRFIHPRAEPEIAFRTSKAIDRALSMEELKDYVDGIAPAIEIIDSRYENFKFSLEDVLADNCSSSGLVVGDWRPTDVDISDLALTLSINGVVKQSGSSKAILNDPWKSLQHASRLANKYGWSIPAGATILAGAATSAEFLAQGDKVNVHVHELGNAAFEMA